MALIKMEIGLRVCQLPWRTANLLNKTNR